MRLQGETRELHMLPQGLEKTRLADARISAQEHCPSLARDHLAPELDQRTELRFSADEPREPGPASSIQA